MPSVLGSGGALFAFEVSLSIPQGLLASRTRWTCGNLQRKAVCGSGSVLHYFLHLGAVRVSRVCFDFALYNKNPVPGRPLGKGENTVY